MFGGWNFTGKKKARGKKKSSSFKSKKSSSFKSTKLTLSKKLTRTNKRKKYKGGTIESCNLYGFSGQSDALGMSNLRI